MTILVNLVGDGCPVLVSDRTRDFGGSFSYEPLRPYDPLPMKWAYEQLIRYPSATLIDVGANTGCYTLLSKHHPNLRVEAFEPVFNTYSVLVENIGLNDLHGPVTPHMIGVSSYDGIGQLHAIREIGGSGVSMVDGNPTLGKDTIDTPIQVITLDTFCREYGVIPHMIKIDVEGGEMGVLQGAIETIYQHHPFLIIEYSEQNAKQYGYAPWEIVRFVENMGYVWTNPEGLDLWCVHKQWEQIK